MTAKPEDSAPDGGEQPTGEPAETKRLDGLPLNDAETERLDGLPLNEAATERLDGLPLEDAAAERGQTPAAAPAPTRRELREQDRASAPIPPQRRAATTPTERFETPIATEAPSQAARRFPWPPVLIGVGIGAVGALLVVGALTMASGIPTSRPDTSTPVPAPPAASPTKEAATPEPEQPAAQPEAPAPAPRPEAGPNECVDALGDGGVDLDTAAVARDDGDLVTRVVVADALPSGDSGVGIILASRNGQRAFQLGVALSDGVPERLFVVDLADGDEYDLDLDDVRVDGATITATFPDGVLRRMGNDWRWYAFATAEGAELDACPGSEQSPEWLVYDD